MTPGKAFPLCLLFFLLLSGASSSDSITKHHHHPPQSAPILPHSYVPPSHLLLALVLLIFFVIGFVAVYLCRLTVEFVIISPFQNHAAGSGNQHQENSTDVGGLDPKVIASFPVFAYSAVRDVRVWEPSLDCPICLCEFADVDVLRLLPACGHSFHLGCIDRWLVSHSTCPVCRCNLSSDVEAMLEVLPIIAELQRGGRLCLNMEENRTLMRLHSRGRTLQACRPELTNGRSSGGGNEEAEFSQR